MFLSKLDSLNDALKLINDNQKVMGTEEIPLAEAHERVLAEDIIPHPLRKVNRENAKWAGNTERRI